MQVQYVYTAVCFLFWLTVNYSVEARQYFVKLTLLCFRFEIQARLFVLTRLEKKELKWTEWDCTRVMEWEEIRSGAHSIRHNLGIGLELVWLMRGIFLNANVINIFL